MKKLILNPSILISHSALALTLRLILGIVFFAHGAQKVLGWYGGHGLTGTTTWMNTQLGTPLFLAYLACFVEFFGAIFLIFGLFTRIWAAGLAVTMIVAMSVHTGFFSPNGYEYALTLLFISVASFLAGSGNISVDHKLLAKD